MINSAKLAILTMMNLICPNRTKHSLVTYNYDNTCTSKLYVAKMQHACHDPKDVHLIFRAEVEHLHGSPHDGKELSVPYWAPVTVIGHVVVNCVPLIKLTIKYT